jgi:thioredoxin 1
MTEITERYFEKEVLKCKLPVFTCLTTKWCHSCYPTCLFADELLNKYYDKVKYVKIDIEESPEVAQRYNVGVVPTIIIFKDSRPVKKLLGFQDQRSLKALLDSLTSESNSLPSRRSETNEAQECMDPK